MTYHLEVTEVLLDFIVVLKIARHDVKREARSLHFHTNAMCVAKLRDEKHIQI